MHISDKGYGFIKSDSYENNLFFHAREVLGVRFEELTKGDKISFDDVIESERGLSAKVIRATG